MDATELLKARKSAWELARLKNEKVALLYRDGRFRFIPWSQFKGAEKDETFLRQVQPYDPEPTGDGYV
jgi:hypothetical protein